MRKKIVAGNWKMNTLLLDGKALAEEIANFAKSENVDCECKGLVIAPPFTHLSEIKNIIKDTKICLAAQNCASEEKGAYTGEISAEMLASIGCDAVILGHSERRAYFNETNEILIKKVNLGLKNNLHPIFCCGETLSERESNKHFDVIQQQLEEVVFKFSKVEFNKMILAYEPVWAIGTGKTATAEQAQEMHEFIRGLIENNYDEEIAINTPILYGGSCKPSNSKELFSKPDVDGGLIGGAALKADDFKAIFESF